jgi:hypothetical protein
MPLPIITEPGAEPSFVGSNVIEIATYAPGATDTGTGVPVSAYMSPLRFSLVRIASLGPVFLIVT